MAEKAPSRRKQQAIATRKKIYDTAIELFSNRGFENVTVDDICNALGLSKGAFYTHFQSKDQVITEYFMNVDKHYEEIYEGMSRIKSGVKKLATFSDFVLRYMDNLGISAMRVIYNIQIAPGEKTGFMISPARSLYRVLGNIVEQGKRAGEIRKDISTEQLVHSLVACYRGIIYTWLLYNGERRLGDIGKPILKIIIQGLRPR